MNKTLEDITLSKKDYQVLWEAYQKLGEILVFKKKKQQHPCLNTLYGIWPGVKVSENDLEAAKKSLFKAS